MPPTGSSSLTELSSISSSSTRAGEARRESFPSPSRLQSSLPSPMSGVPSMVNRDCRWCRSSEAGTREKVQETGLAWRSSSPRGFPVRTCASLEPESPPMMSGQAWVRSHPGRSVSRTSIQRNCPACCAASGWGPAPAISRATASPWWNSSPRVSPWLPTTFRVPGTNGSFPARPSGRR